MDAVYNGATRTTRRVVAIFMAVLVAALLAGGVGGYLIRGASTLVQGQASTTQLRAQAPALTGPFTEPHDGASIRAPFPLTEPHDAR